MDMAVLSSKFIASSLSDKDKTIIANGIIKIAMMPTDPQSERFNDPTVHSYTADIARGLALNIKYAETASNKNIKEIPIRIIVIGVHILNLDNV